MKVRYSLRARGDLAEIADYLVERNPGAAVRFSAAFRRSIVLIQAFPKRGRKQATENVRKVGVGKYAYNIFYKIHESEIVILQVRHTARRTRHKNS